VLEKLVAEEVQETVKTETTDNMSYRAAVERPVVGKTAMAA
jgi:hypothetical protein